MLPPTDRSSLLNDAFSLAAAGQLSYVTPLRLAAYLRAEKHYIPWKTAVDELTGLQYRLRYTELYAGFRVRLGVGDDLGAIQGESGCGSLGVMLGGSGEEWGLADRAAQFASAGGHGCFPFVPFGPDGCP